MSWLRRLLSRPTVLDMARFAPLPAAGYVVGGALRDALLGRDFRDVDWLVPDPQGAAEQAAKALKGSAFVLDDVRKHWRVVAAGEVRDYAPLDGDLESNLLARDFTVNAIAATAEGRLIDPAGGQVDLKHKHIRMVSADNLAADPLRPLRGLRLAITLGFELEEATRATMMHEAQQQASGERPLPAWERIQQELSQLLLDERAAYGISWLEQLGLLDLYVSELMDSRGVQQGGFHHLDVLDHQIEALHQLIQGFPDAPLALRWGTLLHDVAKPLCKKVDEESGRYHFYGHAEQGAALARRLLERLRYSQDTVTRASQLVKYHMLPLPKNHKEARRFVHRRRELLPDLLKLMIADREAARGKLSSENTRRAYRMALAQVIEIMKETPPAPPLLNGEEVMSLLGLKPGKEVGLALDFVKEAEAVGDVSNQEEAKEALKHFAQAQGWTLRVDEDLAVDRE